MILAKFVRLDKADSLDVIQLALIDTLNSNKRVLQRENKVLRAEIEEQKDKALKRRKIPWIVGAVGLVSGFFIGNRIK
jgi:hypothetical protein